MVDQPECFRTIEGLNGPTVGHTRVKVWFLSNGCLTRFQYSSRLVVLFFQVLFKKFVRRNQVDSILMMDIPNHGFGKP